MIINKTNIKADSGKLLKLTRADIAKTSFDLGINYINGEQINITSNDVIEVIPINILGKDYYITSDDYSNAVSELIRKKYSLDQELALFANSRINPNSQEEKDFQEWRMLCKKAASFLK